MDIPLQVMESSLTRLCSCRHAVLVHCLNVRMFLQVVVNLFGWFDKTGDSFLTPLCLAVVCSYQLNDGFVGARSENDTKE
jgi:hypothetical protein